MMMKTIDEQALEKYPIFISETSDQNEEYDSHESDRITYTEGLEDQLNRDIELTRKWWTQFHASNCILKEDYDYWMNRIDEFINYLKEQNYAKLD